MKILIFVLLAMVMLHPVVAATCTGSTPNCLSCNVDDTTSCNRCEAGFRLVISNTVGSCVVCQAGRGRAADISPRLGPTFCDVVCGTGCNFCGATAQNCLGCREGYQFIFSGKYCMPCRPGTGRDSDSVTQTADSVCGITCSPSCKFCGSTSDLCFGCYAGYRLNILTRKCDRCLDQRGSEPDLTPRTTDGTCTFSCNTGTRFCGPGAIGFGCMAGYRFDGIRKTCSLCPNGFTIAPDTEKRTTSSTCDIPCDAGCTRCTLSMSYCTGCRDGYSFDYTTSTCKICPEGKGITGGINLSGSTTCTFSCSSPSCIACSSNPDQCKGCKAGFTYNAAGLSCSSCAEGTGRAADSPHLPFASTTCNINCDTSKCRFCGASPTECTGCDAGFRLDYASKTCVACPSGRTKAADTSSLTRDGVCSSMCAAGCAACDPLTPSICTYCEAGYRTVFVSSQRVCLACAGGQGNAEELPANNADTSCSVECAIGCETCSADRNYCISCSAGYYMSKIGICTLCPAGFGKPYDVFPAQVSTTNGAAECSSTCHFSCNSCKGPGANDCLNCNGHFYFDGIQTCTECPGTLTKDADTKIVKNPGSSSDCNKPCSTSCTKCRGSKSNNCIRCPMGIFRDNSGQCLTCPSGISKLADSVDKTTASTFQAECNIACSTGCKHCTGSGSTECTSCKGGYYKSGSSCLRCADGSGIQVPSEITTAASTTSCTLTCSKACVVCTMHQNADSCLMCGAGYYMAEPSKCRACPPTKGKAKDSNPISGFQAASVCTENCYSTCKMCSSSSSSGCVLCKDGHFWSNTGECSQCGYRTGFATMNEFTATTVVTAAACSACNQDLHCALCSGSSLQLCVGCDSGYFMSAQGICTACPDGKGTNSYEMLSTVQTDGGAAKCSVSCDAGCSICSGPANNQCVLCRKGYFWSAVGVCTECPPGKGKEADTSPPSTPVTNTACTITCHASCASCFGTQANKCTKCAAGFYMSAANTCTICPAGRGKNADATIPTPTTDANTACAAVCPSCLSCDQSGSCLMCARAKYIAPLGSCTDCPPGKGKEADYFVKTVADTSNVCWMTCHASCFSCFGTAANECLKCNTGFYKTAAGVCTQCPQGRGKAVDNTVITPVGTIDVNMACDLECLPASNCYNCGTTAADGCVNCPAAYYFDTDKACKICTNGKSKLADLVILAQAISMNAWCTTQCDASCKTCIGTPQNCLVCASGYYWSASGQCSPCANNRGSNPSGFYTSPESESTGCYNCDASCLACSGPNSNNCIKCRAGHYLALDFTCRLCGANKGKIADTQPANPSTTSGATECNLNCHSSCSNCLGSGQTECLNCNAGRYYSATGTCSSCPALRGKVADTTVQLAPVDPLVACPLCHSSCYTCNGPFSTQCTRCADGHFFAGSGVCTKCEHKKGKTFDSSIPTPTDSTTACIISCHSSCSICKGPTATDCLNCNVGFWWAGDGTCTQCPDYRGKIADMDVQTTGLTISACTETCNDACILCWSSSAAQCIKCAAGHYLSAATTCTICPAGRGKVKDTNTPTVSTTSGDAECGLRCHASCANCFDETAQGCINCSEGYFMSQLGTCVLCPATKGKATDTIVIKTAQTDSVCLTCSTECQHCSGVNPNQCLSCKAGLFLTATGTCAKCPSDFGKAADLQLATKAAVGADGSLQCTTRCHPSCKFCKGSTEDDCLACNTGFYYTGNGKCTVCLADTGKLADTDFMTLIQLPATCIVDCEESCQTCGSTAANSCQSCKASFYKSSLNVCTRCPAKKGKRADVLTPSPIVTAPVGCDIDCAYPCSVCTDSTSSSCVTCTEGHFMKESSKCHKCPFGFGKIADLMPKSLSTTEGVSECNVQCHKTCSSCADTTAASCVGCAQGFYWDNGICKNCPMSTSKPQADATGFTIAQTSQVCSLKCHSSCQMCSGPSETECLSCSAGYWWAGAGKCTRCPSGRGKAADQNLFPTTPATEEACNIYCDVCSSGCQTCTDDPFACASCVAGRYLSIDSTCALCPDNCVSCTDSNKCDKCAANYKVAIDGKTCEGDCTVPNCVECPTAPSKCTKCSDEFVLKSETECFFDQGTVVVDELREISVLESPQLSMDILSDKIELAFSARESRNITSVTVQDKLSGRVYSCKEVSCTYAIKNDKLSFDFNPDFTIVQGKLTVDRAGSTKATGHSPAWVNSQKNRRTMQSQANYPIVVDNIALMSKSYLNSMSFALRVTVGVLRLPLSLLVFWKYPHLAMLMDHMVTHLKIYSLLGQPYMAYVEVVYQSVSDSKVLPFNFENPFEKWDTQTLDCQGFPAIRCKNLHCSWLDNYGLNFIGLISITLLILIMYQVCQRLVTKNSPASNWQRLVSCISKDYGLKYLVAKLDGNHVEIVLMTVIAYCTAEGSSKSVVGLILGTLALVAYGSITLHVTWETQRVYQSKFVQTRLKPLPQAPDQTVRLQVLNEKENVSNSRRLTVNPESDSHLRVSELKVSKPIEFMLNDSAVPMNNWSVYFFAARYVRALLLAVFITTVRDPVEQVVLVVVLEAVYLVALILFDFRGSRLERLFHTSMHGLMLLHLIVRAVATSKSLSDADVQSSLAPAIVVMLMVYIFSHVVVALLILAGIFRKTTEPQVTDSPENSSPSKIDIIDEDEQKSPTKQPLNMKNEQEFSLPAAPPMSYRDLEIPDEGIAEEGPNTPQELDEKHEASKIEHIRVRVDAHRATGVSTHEHPSEK